MFRNTVGDHLHVWRGAVLIQSGFLREILRILHRWHKTKHSIRKIYTVMFEGLLRRPVLKPESLNIAQIPKTLRHMSTLIKRKGWNILKVMKTTRNIHKSDGNGYLHLSVISTANFSLNRLMTVFFLKIGSEEGQTRTELCHIV